MVLAVLVAALIFIINHMGYIFIKPFKALKTVTWIPGFVNDGNFEKAACVALKMRFIKKRPESAAEMNAAMSEYFNGK